eukprot:NODE_2027_length_1300_cov_88.817562_g1929_i0.p1 GENE.NODE_2027_length_1300_cov_88.817562_g1929_i0~~NODE_2027_length_1300_cov_88.817562_g1929_i0.p1  ORF type:complete len:407 (+),score=109.29 NODE_2027_length_1300_cov_88.817562_g1929_i0:44-1222(+)
MPPLSCDTFVVLPPCARQVVFGKNSDRPQEEVQELVFCQARRGLEGTVQCTYIAVQQASSTHAVVLSKPSWMWGAEMGANDAGVVIGNEAVWTKTLGPGDLQKRLLGMDLVRLGLERGATAHQAMRVIVALLAEHGQGGPCSNDTEEWAYHNSFLIADSTEAWVLETVGEHWAAERVSSGVRNISNELSIRTQFEESSPNLEAFALTRGFWDGVSEFDFAKVFTNNFREPSPNGRYGAGRRMITDMSKSGSFALSDMMSVLRDEDSGICMTGSFTTTGSQISLLGEHPQHWFTATANPAVSLFKPYVFGEVVGSQTVSPLTQGVGTDLTHFLWWEHELAVRSHRSLICSRLQELEQRLVLSRESFQSSVEAELSIYHTLFETAVPEELECAR